MKAVVVYESMYGNTHLIADAVAAGLRTGGRFDEVTVVPVDDATPAVLADADLLIVGGPTHAHGMSHTATRKAAIEATHKPDNTLRLDPDAPGPGLREWFASLGRITKRAAAFDTRVQGPAVLTGRASAGIARKLHQHGCQLVVAPESFLVDKTTHLTPSAAAEAQRWGAELSAATETADR